MTRPVYVSGLCGMLLSVAVLDLVARQLTRRSLAAALGGEGWAVAWDVAFIAAALLLIGVDPGATRRAKTLVLFTGLFGIGVALQLHLGARLQSDGFYYYAYARSIWFDGDVDLTNDYRLLGLDDAQHAFLFMPTATGHAQTTWAIGPALLWSPFFGVGHLVALALAPVDPRVAADGTSFPYRQAVCLAGLFYGLVGLFLSYQFARSRFRDSTAAWAVAATALGSFVLWYLVREPTMSHAVSLAAVAVVCHGWSRVERSANPRSWALLGLAGGVMMAVRWQNAIVLLLPAVSLTRLAWRGPDRRAAAACALVFAGGALVSALPQLLAWRAIYGTWIARSEIAPAMHWWHPQLVDVLWSSRNGLFATSPAIYLAALGLFVLWRRDRALAASGLAIVALMIWTNAAVDDWYGGAGFGGRRFDSLVPLFVCGQAALISAATVACRRHPMACAAVFAGLLVAWNATLVAVGRHGGYQPGRPVSFAEVSAAQASVVHDWIGHPFSVPASLFWAWRNRLPPGAFDVLRPNRFLSDPRQPYGRIDIGTDDDRYLGRGWGPPRRQERITYRQAESLADVLIPLDRSADLLMQVRVAPLQEESTPTAMTVIVNGATAGSVRLATGWQVAEIRVPGPAWHGGVNRLSLRFQPGAAGPSLVAPDPQPVVAVDYVRLDARQAPRGGRPAGGRLDPSSIRASVVKPDAVK